MAGKYWWESNENESKDGAVNNPGQSNAQGYWWDSANISNTVGRNVTDRVNNWIDSHNAFISDNKMRYSGRKFTYEDAYVSDSASWLDATRNRKNELELEADDILAYLDQYADYLDADWAKGVRETITSASEKHDQILKTAASDNEFWSSFTANEALTLLGYTSEDIYKNWQSDQKQYADDMAYDVEAGMVELEQLKRDRDAFLADQEEKRQQAQQDESFFDKMGRWLSNTPDTSIPVAGASAYVGNTGSTGDTIPAETYNKRIAELEGKINRAKYIQGYEGYMDYMEADDYATGCKYVSTRTDVAMEDARWGFGNTMYDTSKLFGDFLYDYINGNQDARDAAMVNDATTNAYFLGLDQGFLKSMSDEEIGVYNYLYKTQGKESANEFLTFIASDLKGRRRAEEQSQWAEYAKEDPVGSSVFSVLISPLKPISAVGQVADYIEDGTIDQNAGYNKFSYIPSTIRGQVASDIATPQNGVWGEVGSWTYQLGMSTGDFLMNSAISGGNSAISLALMGSSAMADTVISAKDRGLSDDQAMILGVVAGAAEIVTEKFSLDALFSGDLSKGAMRYILTNAFTEGTEEVSSSLINLVADVIVSKDKSEWEMAINDYLEKNPNATEEEAFQNVLNDTIMALGFDYIGGSLMGGSMGSVGAGINNVQQSGIYRRTGKKITAQKGRLENLQNLAVELGKNDPGLSEFYAKISDKVAEGDTRQVGRLYARVAESAKAAGYDIRQFQNMVFGSSAVASDQRAEATKGKPSSAPSGSTFPQGKVKGAATEATTAGEGTFVRSTGKALESVKFASVEQGKVTVEVEDGETVSLSDVSFAEEAQEVVATGITGIKNVSVTSANGMWQIYQQGNYGANAGAFTKAAMMTYQAGFQGDETALKPGDSRSAALNPAHAEMIYQMGREDAEAYYNRQQAKVDAQKKTAAEKGSTAEKKGGVFYGYEGQTIDQRKVDKDHKRLSKAQRVGIDFVKRLSKKFGTQFYFYESYEDGQGNRVYKDRDGNVVQAEKGFYDPKDGSIHIDLAGDKILFTISHELVHQIKDWAPKQFKVMADIVMKGFSSNDVPLDVLIAEQQKLAKEHGRKLTEEEAFEEVIANALEGVMADGKVAQFLQQLEGRDKRLGARVRRFFHDIAQLIRDTLDAYAGVQPDSVEGIMISQLEDTYKQLQKALAEGIYQAGENFRQAEKNSTGEGGVRYATRNMVNCYSDYNKPITSADIAELQKIERKSINKFSRTDLIVARKWAYKFQREIGTKSPFFRAWFGDWRANSTAPAEIVAFSYGETGRINYNRRTVKNLDMGNRSITVDDTVIEDSLHYAKKNGDEKHIRKLLGKVDEILKKGILLDTRISNKSSGNKKGSTQFMHYLYTPISINGAPFVAKLTVEEYDLTGKSRAYNLQRIELSALSRAQFAEMISQNREKYAYSADALSVSQLFAFVKQKDSSFQPKPSSKVVNPDGTPMVVYHGTSENFTEFKRSELSDREGSFFFAQNRQDAEAYSGNGTVMEVYVNLQNPIDYNNMPSEIYKLRDKKAQVAALRKLGYDGWLADMDTGWGEISAFNSNQIKSATDNIGTFDGGNPDIRFSVRQKQNPTAADMLRKEVEKLKGDVEKLKELLKLQRSITGGTKFTASSVEAAARVLKKNAGATGDTAELAGLLNRFYEYIATERELTWEGVKEQAAAAADWLQEHVKHRRSDYAQEILDQFHGSKIYLDESQKQEAAHRFGSFNAFRQTVMGSITVANEGRTSLDSFWQEMSALYPDVFDREMTAVDMPGALADVIYRLRNEDTSLLEYAYNRDMIRQDLVRQVYDTYWNVSTLRTFADVKQAQINRLKNEHLQRMQQMKAENREKVEALKESHRAEVEMIRNAYRQRLDKQQKQIVQRYQESRAKAVEGRHKTEMRHKIQRVVKKLNDLLLKETRDKHVPEELKKVVAEALDAVNMDTVGADERVAKYDTLIAEATDPDVIEALTQTRDRIRNQGDRMKERIRKLKDAYEELKNAEGDIANAYDEDLSAYISELADEVGDTPLRDMTMAQLETVYEVYTAVLTTVRNANKAFKEAKGQSIREMGEEALRELKGLKKREHEQSGAKLKAETFFWNNEKPIYAFERIGSKVLSRLYRNLQAGQDTYMSDQLEAKAFVNEQKKKHGYDKWDFEKRYAFESSHGDSFQLSLSQIMSLYAYAKRDQAREHIRRGGIVFDSATEQTKKGFLGIKKKVNVENSTAYNISDTVLAQICGTLTEEQAAFVDEMQKYLSDNMGAKGNDVSMKLYGIRLFKEKHYFPLKSAPEYMEKAREQQSKQGEIKLKNSGMTKATVPKANNPVVLTPFMDVWADHVVDMSMYHSFVLPLEDFYRVYNFKSGQALDNGRTDSVIAAINGAHGKAASRYVDQFLKDLNGGVVADPRESIGKALTGKFKKAAVMASASVVVQQPTAVVRALSMLDARHFFGEQIGKDKMNALWEECKRYAPIAAVKEMGYFDTHMGRSARDFLLAKEYQGIAEMAKGILTDGDYRDEMMSKPAALADEMAWVWIWNAVKRETGALNPDLYKTDRAEFFRIAGERFTDIISRTQVYDSVFSRSANMRSKSLWMNMATSFMGEPTTSANMMESAVRQWQQGDKKGALRTAASVYGSIVVNAMAASLVYAMRDDDEDETFAEKYMAAFVGKTLEGINPMTYYPIVRDIWSLMQGYDVERADMSLPSAMLTSVGQMISLFSKDTEGMSPSELNAHNSKCADALLSAVDAVCSLLGIPEKNIRRDILGLFSGIGTIRQDAEGRATTWSSMIDVLQEAIRGSLPFSAWIPGESKADILYDAILSGDTAYVERLRKSYSSDTAYYSAIRTGIKNHYISGDISQEEAEQYLIDYAAMDRDDAYWRVEEWTYENATGEDFSRSEQICDAIVRNDTEYIEEIRNGYSDEADYYSAIRSAIKMGCSSGEVSVDSARKYLVKYGNMDANDAYWKVEEWVFESTTGEEYSKYQNFYTAVESGKNLMQTIKIYTDHGVSEKTLRSQITKKFKPIYLGMSKSERLSLIGYLLNAYTVLGYTREEARKLIDSWED